MCSSSSLASLSAQVSPVFSFIAPLSWPISLAAPISLAVYVLAFAIMAYLVVKKPEALSALSDHGHTGEDGIVAEDLVRAHPHTRTPSVKPDVALEAG